MKKLVKISLGFAALVFFLVIGAVLPIKAEQTSIYGGDDYFVDLNGDGKDEKIFVDYTYEEFEYGTFPNDIKVYINDKKVFDKSNLPEQWVIPEVYTVDINPADEYIEFMLDFVEDGDDHSIYVYRYKKNKLGLLFQTYYNLVGEQDNNNKVKVYDMAVCAVGNCSLIVRNCKIKNKELVEVNPKGQTYTVLNSDAILHKAAKSITVYKKSDGAKAVKTIKKGTEFRITKLKYIDGEAVYAQIVIKGKKKAAGWINVEMYEGCSWEDKLVENPLFAG